VQVADACESGGKCGDNNFLGCEGKEPNVVGIVINNTEEVFGSACPSLLERAEDVRAECMKASRGFGAMLSAIGGMVQIG
jgi:hypothetical protein